MLSKANVYFTGKKVEYIGQLPSCLLFLDAVSCWREVAGYPCSETLLEPGKDKLGNEKDVYFYPSVRNAVCLYLIEVVVKTFSSQSCE